MRLISDVQGTQPAASYTVIHSGTKIVAYPPAESAGTVGIKVTTPGGTTTPTLADQYTFLAP